MTKKIALITGANKGIGFETARQLGALGYTVLIGARDQNRGAEAVEELSKDSGRNFSFIAIDPTDKDSIEKAVAEVGQKFGVLDVLINNAGTMVPGDFQPTDQVKTDALRETYEINVFGLHEVTTAFWPLLNKSEGARLVNVSSALGSLTLHADGSMGDFKAIAYDSSKAAVNMMTIHYAYLWKGTPHKANAIHPGSVKTDLNPNGELSVQEGAKTSVRLATVKEDGPNGGFFHMNETLPW